MTGKADAYKLSLSRKPVIKKKYLIPWEITHSPLDLKNRGVVILKSPFALTDNKRIEWQLSPAIMLIVASMADVASFLKQMMPSSATSKQILESDFLHINS